MRSIESTSDERLAELLDRAVEDVHGCGAISEDRARVLREEFPAEGDALTRTLQGLTDVLPRHEHQTATVQLGETQGVVPPPTGGLPAVKRIGRYEVLELLGRGGMGAVYKARDPQLGRLVALKIPHLDPHRADHAQIVQRFLREARAAAAVRHPNICPIHDVLEENGTPCVVLAYIEGRSLAAHLKQVSNEEPRVAVEKVAQIAEALAALHEQSILHRDLKPANILLDANETALLTDFGLARLAADTENLTAEGVLVGTPAYMAPEQLDGTPPSPLTDVYSLGVVLYESLAGHPPFQGEILTLIQKINTQPPASLRSIRSDVPASLETIVSRSMAKNPEDRYPSAHALAEALRGWLAGREASSSDVETVALPLPRRTHRHGLWWLIAAVLLLAVAGVVALTQFALKRSEPTEQAHTTSGTGSLPLTELDQETPNGDLLIQVWTGEELRQGAIRKKGLRVDENPAALPVVNGERVHLAVQLDRPAYVYLVWVSPVGEVQPLFPWDPDPDKGFKAPIPEANRGKRSSLHSPNELDSGWDVEGAGGLDTAVLLVRNTPLPDSVSVKELFGTPPESPLSDRQEVIWLGHLPGQECKRTRAVNTKAAQKIDDPWLALMERLRPHFPVVKMMRFAHVEK